MNCPICQKPLFHQGKSFVCKNHHTFDQARQGYVNLSRKQKAAGDNAEMVKARTAFLESGLYDFMAEQVANLIQEKHPHTYLDLGCGQGYYTKRFAPLVDEAYGVDLSVPAIAHAAGQDKKTQYIVSSIYSLPFEKQSIDLLTSIFTPIPAKEAARVLKDTGELITVTPGKMHHYELKDVLYPEVRLNDELQTIEGFELIDQTEITQKQHVTEVKELLNMTPYRYKTSKEDLEKLDAVDALDVTCSFLVSRWRKK